MKKRCSILTLKTKNYGGILQAVALQRTIINFGIDCSTVDLVINKRHKGFKNNLLSFLYQKIVLKLFGDKKRKKRTKLFLNNYLRQTKLYKEKNFDKYLNSTVLDCVVVGSDQVWNDKMFNTSNVFFYPYEKKCRLISYAASFGYGLAQYFPQKYHLDLIRRFDKVSVREEDANEFLNNNSIKSSIVLDPTFLLSRSEWEKMSLDSQICKKNEKYGFVYIMPGDEKMVSFIKKAAFYYSQKYKTTFYIVGLKETDRSQKHNNVLSGVGPTEWLNLLINSEWVLTNSFHGTVFALMFHKKIGAVINNQSTINYPGRIVNLLKTADAVNSIIQCSNTQILPELIKHDNFDTVFNNLIDSSKQWICNALGANED